MKEIYMALSKAQRNFKTPKRDTQGYGYLYSQLDQVIECVRASLLDNELYFYQVPVFENGLVGVETTVYHSSGQTISSKTFTKHNCKNIQEEGSAITYLRRYSLLSMFGLAPEDLDASDLVRGDTTSKRVENKTDDDFVFKFGKFKGMKLSEFKSETDIDDLESWLDWFKKQPVSDPKNEASKKEMISKIEKYLEIK